MKSAKEYANLIFFGSHVLGPLLIKNPEFLKNISAIITNRIKVFLNKKDEEMKAVLEKMQSYAKSSYEIVLRPLLK